MPLLQAIAYLVFSLIFGISSYEMWMGDAQTATYYAVVCLLIKGMIDK